MNHRKKFGENVRRSRTEQGLSQEGLAEKVGLHRTYIGSIERGERNVSLDNIVAIAQALKIPFADLFEGIRVTNAN
jgi:transcriptional regulator with XRE-family HTH domain